MRPMKGLLVAAAVLFFAAPLRSQGGFIINGRVSLPNGQPAPRVRVTITGFNGLDKQTLTDDQGAYQFMFIPGGRYSFSVTNPQDPAQFSDPVQADTARTTGNRLIVHLYLRSPEVKVSKSHRPAVLTVAEAAQRIPKDALKAYEKGLKYQAEKKHGEALSSFDRALELYPSYFQALTARGELRIVEGKLAEAFADFDRALKLDEEHQPAWRGAGFCQLGVRAYPEAARYLMRALELSSSDAQAHLYLGITLIGLKQNELAEQAFLQALKHDPEATAAARVYLADIYSHEKNYTRAADELQAYLKARPGAANHAKLKSKEAEFRARAAETKRP